MSDIFQSIKQYLALQEVDIDNAAFKLFSKASVALCLCSSLLCGATQYVGTPIVCNHQGIDSHLVEQYCWIHGSTKIPQEYQKHFDCVTDQATVSQGGPLATGVFPAKFKIGMCKVFFGRVGRYLIVVKIWYSEFLGHFNFFLGKQTNCVLVDRGVEAKIVKYWISFYFNQT